MPSDFVPASLPPVTSENASQDPDVFPTHNEADTPLAREPADHLGSPKLTAVNATGIQDTPSDNYLEQPHVPSTSEATFKENDGFEWPLPPPPLQSVCTVDSEEKLEWPPPPPPPQFPENSLSDAETKLSQHLPPAKSRQCLTRKLHSRLQTRTRLDPKTHPKFRQISAIRNAEQRKDRQCNEESS